jgi:hypothetical protein
MVGAAVLAAVLVQPAAASATGSNLGGGTIPDLSIAFSGTGIAPAGAPPQAQACAPVSFTVSGLSADFVYNTVITGYLGTINISGQATGCDTVLEGGGTLTLTDVRGTGPTGSTINCADPTKSPATTLTGGYTHVGTDLEAVLGGTCYVNNFPARVYFSYHGEFAPTPGSGTTVPGLNAPITSAMAAGAFTVEPA